MRRSLIAGLLAAGLAAVAGLPVAAAQAAGCPANWNLTYSWTQDDSFLFQASADASGDAMAAGYRYVINTAYRPLVLHWTGSSWSAMSVPAASTDTTLSGVAVISGSFAVAVGSYAPSTNDPSRAFAELWNGGSWTRSYPPTYKSDPNTFLPTQLNHAAGTSSSNVWAVGDYITATHVSIPLIEHLGSGGWSVSSALGAGSGASLYDVDTDAAGDAWAVGYRYLNGVESPLAKRWNGTAWSVVNPPGVGNVSQLNGVSIRSSGDVWAVGSAYNGSIHVPIAEHWNGTQWSQATIPSPSSYGGSLTSVKVLGAADVWAFGAEQTDQFGDSAPLIEHYDGSAWSAVESAPGSPPGGDSGYLDGSAYTGGHLLTVGYNQPNGTYAASTMAQQTCPIQVQDGGYAPSFSSTAFGRSLLWSVPSSDAASHSVSDGDGTGLFDSGLIAPGGSARERFDGAGTYKILDTASGHLAHVGVPVSATPASGTTGTSFSIQWAAVPPTSGFVYDVQVKRPGASAYATWLLAQTGTAAAFTPDAGIGTYSFHAELRKLAGGAHSLWSPAVAVSVG